MTSAALPWARVDGTVEEQAPGKLNLMLRVVGRFSEQALRAAADAPAGAYERSDRLAGTPSFEAKLAPITPVCRLGVHLLIDLGGTRRSHEHQHSIRDRSGGKRACSG